MSSDDNSNVAKEWESIRLRFAESIMADTEIFKLAQGVDMTWPLRGREETPNKYILCNFDELQMLPEMAGRPERVQALIDILSQTLEFDDPFSEMAETVDSSSRADDRAEKTMRRLEIPESFPVRFCRLSAETRQFCADENITTLEEFIDFSQRMAQTIVVGGDFRAVLNTFVEGDPRAISKYVPIRPGHQGVHLTETIGLIIQSLSRHEFLSVLIEAGGKVPKEEQGSFQKIGENQMDSVLRQLRAQLNAAIDYFQAEAQQLRDLLSTSRSDVERFFMPLNNPDVEKVAIGLVYTTFDIQPPKPKRKKFLGIF